MGVCERLRAGDEAGDGVPRDEVERSCENLHLWPNRQPLGVFNSLQGPLFCDIGAEVSAESTGWGDGGRQDYLDLEVGRYTLRAGSRDHLTAGLVLHIDNGYHIPYHEGRRIEPCLPAHAPKCLALTSDYVSAMTPPASYVLVLHAEVVIHTGRVKLQATGQRDTYTTSQEIHSPGNTWVDDLGQCIFIGDYCADACSGRRGYLLHCN